MILPWVIDVIVVAGLAVVTLGVYGIVRLPDVYTQLHAASKVSFIGIVLLLVAVSLPGEWPIVARAIVIGALLTVTTPVAAHVVAQAARQDGEPLRTPSAVDETGDAPRAGLAALGQAPEEPG